MNKPMNCFIFLLFTFFYVSQVGAENSQKYIDLEHKVLAANYDSIPVVLQRGNGVWLWDVEGKKYIDMMAAYSAVNHGHAHPRIMKVLLEQSSRLSVPSRAYSSDQLGPFMEKLCQVSGMDRGLPMNTGAEAVETALKAARLWGYKRKNIPEDKAEIIVCANNFHGRTISIISFSTSEKNRDGFGPFTPGFVVVPFGDAIAMEKAITPYTAAVMLEPIQGEAGVIIPPEGYLTEVQNICKKNNVLFIVDEIQSGLGRTGKMFAFQHENLEPDGLIVGKALGGGVLPVSAFLGKEDLMSLFTPGSHGSTFGGNALASAVALEAIKTIEDEQLVENSNVLGVYFLDELRKIDSPIIEGVRGKGLWIAIDINNDIISGHDLVLRLKEKGLLTKETHDKTLRIAPPLIISKEEIDYSLKIIKEVFR